MGRFSLFREFLDYARVRKRWWLLPLMLILAILSLLVVLAEGSALAPFIYTIF
jgi:hypothetical protein